MAEVGVHNLADKPGFDAALKDAGNSLVVLDCFATWCGPCKTIAPKVVAMAKEFPNVKFYKIDVDQAFEVAQELNIRAMPTFVLFKGGEKIDEVVGANEAALKAAVQKSS